MHNYLSWKQIVATAVVLTVVGACSLEDWDGDVYLVDPESADAAVSFAVIGDFGRAGDPAQAVADLIDSISPDFVATVGDNSYNAFTLDNVEENVIAYYEDWIYNPSAPEDVRCRGLADAEQINRFFPSPGNHDYKGDSKLRPYLDFFDLPGNEIYYHFREGEVEIFILDSQRNRSFGKQKRWLKERAAASTALYKILLFHHPPYSVGRHGDQKDMRWDIDDLGIDLVVSGHEHDYQRFKEDDTWYIVNGVGGTDLRFDCHENASRGATFFTCEDRYHGALFVSATSEAMVVSMRTTEPGYPEIDRVVIQP